MLAFQEGVTYNWVMAKKLPPDVLEYFVRMGRKGGLKGGRIRASRMSPEARSASARAAVQARWAKAKRVNIT